MDPNGKSAFMGTRVNGNTLENNFFFFFASSLREKKEGAPLTLFYHISDFFNT